MRALIPLSLALATGVVGAQTITVRGGLSCGKWVEQRQSGKIVWAETWLDGVLTGQSMARRMDLLGGMEAESTYLWMDQYCKANPLKTTMDGVVELVAEIRRQKGL